MRIRRHTDTPLPRVRHLACAKGAWKLGSDNQCGVIFFFLSFFSLHCIPRGPTGDVRERELNAKLAFLHLTRPSLALLLLQVWCR